MQRSTSILRRSTAALFAATLLLSACGSSGGDDAKDDEKATTTAAPADDATTTTEGADEPEDETTTTEGTTDPDAPTTEILEQYLPTAADLGDGWSDDPDTDDGDEDNALGDAIEDQCPAVSAFGDDDDEDTSDRAEAAFVSELNQNLSVSLSPSAEPLDPADLTAAVEGINACEPVTFTDDSNGVTTTVQFQAEEYDELGDQGVRVQGAVTLEAPELGDPVEFTLLILSYRSGTVGVTVKGGDGIDGDTLEVSVLDPQFVMSIGETLATLVG